MLTLSRSIMQSIEQALPQSRYLAINGKISTREWLCIVEAVNAELSSNQTTRAISEIEADQKMINTPLLATQLPLYSWGCYADVPPEYSWDTLFRLDDPNMVVSTTAVSCFGVYFRRGVLKQLQDGHQVDVVIDFPSGVPDLLCSLPIIDGRSCLHRPKLALCRSEDLPAIQAYRNA